VIAAAAASVFSTSANSNFSHSIGKEKRVKSKMRIRLVLNTRGVVVRLLDVSFACACQWRFSRNDYIYN